MVINNRFLVQWGIKVNTATSTQTNLSISYPTSFSTHGIPFRLGQYLVDGQSIPYFVGVSGYSKTGFTYWIVHKNFIKKIFYLAIGF